MSRTSPDDRDNIYTWPFERQLHETFPALDEAQSAWLSQVDSLLAPDRKTHELIRLVCMVIQRNPPGVRLHAMLAREVGASWEDVLGSLMLTCPAFGLLPAAEAIEHARAGFDAAPEVGDDDPDLDNDSDE
jgi:hypothetical protein